MPKAHGVLFDCNGVIIDDYDHQRAAWDVMSLQLRGKKVSASEMEEHILSIPTLDTINWMTDYKLSSNEVFTLGEKKRTILAEMQVTTINVNLLPGVTDTFDFLKENQIPFGIVTAGRKDSISEYFDHFNFGKWFDWDRIVCNDGTHNNKPAPDPYRIGALKIGVEPKQCLVFEDSKSGILSAFAAGVQQIVGIARGRNSSDLLGLPGVLEVVSDFTELNFQDYFTERKRVENAKNEKVSHS